MFYELVEDATELLAADQAGLLLAASEGDLKVMAVTSESTQIVELLQVQDDGGPCIQAYRTGELVQASLDEETSTQWPEFSGKARERGFQYVAAVPMRLRDDVIGALNLFRSEPNRLSDSDLIAARALADIATIAILQERAVKDKDVLVNQLQRALDSRVAIEQAKGVIAEATGLSMDKAFERLRTYSRNNNLRIREVARQVTAGEIQPRTLRAG